MGMSDLTVGGIYIAATVIALYTGGVLWRHREKTAALPLSIAGFSSAVWSFGLFITTLPWGSVALSGITVVYIGVAVGLAAVFVFALEYTGRERYVTPTLLGLLSIHPIFLLGFVIFNPGDLFFIGLDPAAPIGVDQQWGPAFWLHSTYAYLLVLVTSLLIVERLVRTNRALYKGQAILLAAGLFAPLPMNAVFISGVISFDTTPLGFVIMCSLFAVAIIKYRFVDLSPIAREKVIDSVRDGMVVVDTDDRIIDINPAAERMMNIETSVLGASVSEVLNLSESVAAYEELTATTDTSELTVELGDVYYAIESTPIFDGRDRHVGWLFLLQDVTEQKRRERELEQQIEKLDEFASLVSHDLRSPINVANGYIEQTRITGDLDNLNEIERATERMEEIIDDVLELAREGQAVTEPEAVSVDTIAREAWDHTEANGASLSVDGDTKIVADPDRLTRLFENLFRNSVEHGTETKGDDSTPESLAITVGTADETSTKSTLYVADDGLGFRTTNRTECSKTATRPTPTGRGWVSQSSNRSPTHTAGPSR